MANEITLTLFDRSQVGQVELSNEYKVIAKRVQTEMGLRDKMYQSDRFYLKTVGNRLINPADYTLYELKKNDAQFIEVPKDIYDTYQNIINKKSVVSFRSLETRVLNA